jgi:hypothetical protein
MPKADVWLAVLCNGPNVQRSVPAVVRIEHTHPSIDVFGGSKDEGFAWVYHCMGNPEKIISHYFTG